MFIQKNLCGINVNPLNFFVKAGFPLIVLRLNKSTTSRPFLLKTIGIHPKVSSFAALHHHHLKPIQKLRVHLKRDCSTRKRFLKSSSIECLLRKRRPLLFIFAFFFLVSVSRLGFPDRFLYILLRIVFSYWYSILASSFTFSISLPSGSFFVAGFLLASCFPC